MRRKANFTFAQVCLNLGSFAQILNSRKALKFERAKFKRKEATIARKESADRLNLRLNKGD
ncbi:hypothetical protein H740_03898 [Campylobacter showae CC57C]|uniref:Uncharacterized protein n=1 Tax=Campylobacter showae CC57C TaxID=1073353 RepID=M3GZR6_9BACT|nr:hypothetical protein H740_03898 [Campylobacter showae CC57C]